MRGEIFSLRATTKLIPAACISISEHGGKISIYLPAVHARPINREFAVYHISNIVCNNITTRRIRDTATPVPLRENHRMTTILPVYLRPVQFLVGKSCLRKRCRQLATSKFKKTFFVYIRVSYQ